MVGPSPLALVMGRSLVDRIGMVVIRCARLAVGYLFCQAASSGQSRHRWTREGAERQKAKEEHSRLHRKEKFVVEAGLGCCARVWGDGYATGRQIDTACGRRPWFRAGAAPKATTLS